MSEYKYSYELVRNSFLVKGDDVDDVKRRKKFVKNLTGICRYSSIHKGLMVEKNDENEKFLKINDPNRILRSADKPKDVKTFSRTIKSKKVEEPEEEKNEEDEEEYEIKQKDDEEEHTKQNSDDEDEEQEKNENDDEEPKEDEDGDNERSDSDEESDNDLVKYSPKKKNKKIYIDKEEIDSDEEDTVSLSRRLRFIYSALRSLAS